MGKVHWIAMAGLRGYLPQYVWAHETYASAVGDLVQLHGLSRRLAGELKRYGWVELVLGKHGNEYAEVGECDCDNPEEHEG